jgi:ElaB/YqjD/DUF883 family membrane-anchored ribosome-binding protein
MENPLKKSDIDAISADIERLKKDLAKTMEHVKNGATNAASNLADDMSDEAEALYRSMAKRGDRAARALGKHVEEQPMSSLLMAFAAGFFLSRLTDRR